VPPSPTQAPPPPAPATSAPAPAPASTPIPAPAAAAPGGPLSAPAPTTLVAYSPAQIEQGGFTIVYLNSAEATSATLRFGGKTYPMLKQGTRWWAIVGVGALAGTGAAPVSISYVTPAGQQNATSSVNIVHRDFPSENIDLDDTTSQLLAPDTVNAELAKRSSIYDGYTQQRLWNGPWIRPNNAALSDVYGILRSYNHGPITSYHTGTDFAAFDGTAALAAGAGRVALAGPLTVRGNSVIIDHGAGVFTAYHHLSRIDVAQGQMVTAGQQVGLTGHTGLVTGPHLHWEVIIRGVEVDGLLWLKGTEIGP